MTHQYCQLVLTVLLCSTFVNSDVYYISPDSHNCSASFCFTLTQFTSKALHHNISNNTSLIFQSGNYSLTTDLTFSDIDGLSLFSPSRVTWIVCDQFAKLSFFNVRMVQIRNLSFLGCEGNVKFAKDFITEDILFHGQNYSSSALVLIQTTAKIVNSTFRLNKNGKCIYSFPNEGCQARIGGAIFISQSNVSISNCMFVENSANFGGAIASERRSAVVINSTMFVNNIASLGFISSSISVSECKFRDSKGTVIYFRRSNVIIMRNEFSRSYGGKIFEALIQSSITDIGGIYQYNAAIFHIEDSSATFNHSTFYANYIYDFHKGLNQALNSKLIPVSYTHLTLPTIYSV